MHMATETGAISAATTVGFGVVKETSHENSRPKARLNHVGVVQI